MMIPPAIDRLLRRLARYEAYQLLKDHPAATEVMWHRGESEDAEFTTRRRSEPVKRKTSQSTGAHPPKVGG